MVKSSSDLKRAFHLDTGISQPDLARYDLDVPDIDGWDTDEIDCMVNGVRDSAASLIPYVQWLEEKLLEYENRKD